MAHLIEQMFSVEQTPWHRLGKVVYQAPNAEEAINLAGLNWQVNLKPLFTEDGVKVKNRAVVRSDNNDVLGVVGKDWTPVQNSKAFEFFDKFIDAKECTFETAGSLMSGRKVWILAKINREPITVTKNDIVNKYILLSMGHDGLNAVKAGFTPIRVVCANTLRMAEENHNSHFFSLRHSKQVNSALDEVKQTINAADRAFNATGEQYKRMLKVGVKKKDIERFVKFVFFSDQELKQRQETRFDKMNETITKLFETGYGNNLKNVSGTGWALYNSATQYLSYDAGRNDDSRLNGLWFNGSQARQNQKAFEFILNLGA